MTSDSSGDALLSGIPHRAASWRLRTRTLNFPRPPLIMGILNVTPDSFSDGGQFQDASHAVDRARVMADQGADLLDIGGESTRPYSDPIDEREELQRVLPVLQRLEGQLDIPISIDTSKANVAREAVAAGAEIINDVTGLEGDPGMLDVALGTGAGVCVMHMRGTPQTMQEDPHYDDVTREIGIYLKQRRDALVAAGLPMEKIALDPGIGFGKTHEHNLTLLSRCHEFHACGCPLLVGHSRKEFIAKVSGRKEGSRLGGTIGVTLALALRGVQVIRVHDVQEVREALDLFIASGGLESWK